MANIKSQIKRNRTNEERRKRNQSVKSSLRTAIRGFREAVEAKDMDALDALLADDVVFRSPIAHTPYPGKAITSAILRAVVEVFEDFRYVRQLRDGSEEAYVFEAKVDGLDITGCDFLTLDDEGWRPYNGGGMHDPGDVTGGHYDHLHVTVKAG